MHYKTYLPPLKEDNSYLNDFSWAPTKSQHIIIAILRKRIEKGNLASSVGDIHKEKQFITAFVSER